MKSISASKKQKNVVSPMEWFAWAWIGLFFLLGIRTNGIFQGLGLHRADLFMVYEKPQLYGFLIMIAAMIWVGFHVFQKQLVFERRMGFGIASLLLCGVYVISGFQAYSPLLSLLGILIGLMIFTFFTAGTFLVQYERIIRILPSVYLVFGYLIVLYGFLNLFGNEYLMDAMVFYEAIRITSIFQYANAYAVFLLTLLIVILVELIKTSNRKIQLAHSLMLVPVCVSFLLTLSRGALILLPVVAIIILLMFRLRQQVMIMVYSIIAMALSLSIYSNLENKGTVVYERIQQTRASQIPFDTVSLFSSASLSGWLLIIGVSVVMTAAVYYLQKYLDPLLVSKVAGMKVRGLNQFIPLAFIGLFVGGALLITTDWVSQFLPEVIRSRVENINLETHSVYERFTMYRDAVAIWQENPIIGGGSGVWDALYDQYQSYPYQSGQTHSYVTQLLVEVGAIGLAVYTGFILTVIVVFVRYYRRANEDEQINLIFYFMVPVTILLHSLIDFEMSYLWYIGVVFLCLGVMTGTQRQQVKVAWSKKAFSRIRWGVSVVLFALIVVICVITSKQFYAINQVKQSGKASAAKSPFNLVVDPLKKGLSKAPGHPLLLHQLLVIYYQAYDQTKETVYLEEARQYLAELMEAEPHYRPSIELNYAIALITGDKQKAAVVMEEGIRKNPFDQSFYDKAAFNLTALWTDAQAQGSSDKSLFEERIMNLYEQMKQREQTVLDLPDTVNLMRTFTLTNTVRLAAGKVAYYQGDYAKADEILVGGVREELVSAEDRQVARYYLAALRKQGEDDSGLYERIVGADSGEAEEIDLLLKKTTP